MCGRRAPELACDELDSIILAIIKFDAADVFEIVAILSDAEGVTGPWLR